jgi:hypothetical protein
MPQRIQRKRTKGWRMPEGAVYVGRPSVWGNPYRHGGRDLQVRMFRQMIEGNIWSTPNRQTIKDSLTGKDLACWCPLDQPCHADVLLEIANPLPLSQRRRHGK